MKWIKFLKDYDNHKAGEIVSLDASEVKVLVKAGVAEETQEPTEVGSKVSQVADGLKTLITEEIGKGFDEIKAGLKAGSGNRPHITGQKDNEDDDPTFGFKSMNDQVRAIKGWYMAEDGARNDTRMKRLFGHATKAPSTYSSEGTGSDGGFMLAPNFSNELLKFTFDDDSLFTRTRSYTTGSNSLTVPKDETTPWGTTGVRVYWNSEAGQATQSKLALGQDNLILNKLSALVPVTDEQLQDSFTGLGDYVTQLAGERIRWAVDDAIVAGTGVGKPLGFANSGAIYSQAAESAQTAATINITNIAKMISRVPGTSIKNLVWLIHPSAFPQLVILTNGNTSLYVAPGGVANANPNYGSLFGIPVIISQHCQAIGTLGDIYLVDLSQYITLTKGDGIQSAMSIHLFFDYNVSTFRFNFRIAGQPWASAPITSANGSYSMSSFVSLAAR